MAPKMLAMTLVILAGTAVSLFAVMEPLFHVPIKGSVLLAYFMHFFRKKERILIFGISLNFSKCYFFEH
jgi:hypothetical protein